MNAGIRIQLAARNALQLVRAARCSMERMTEDGKSRGNRTPDDEIDERVAIVKKMISHGNQKSTIKRYAYDNWGVCARTVENYIARARSEILEDASLDRMTVRAESIAFYSSIQASEEAQVQERLKARERIDKIFAVDQVVPVQIEHSGKVEHSITSVDINRLADAFIAATKSEVDE